ncbi:hypothetical protein [Pseudomonas aeruginosa]|uniref:hypothetical protein n=1 Tax=Pseudomonas aeruginosa TaxID=287 RepID=UPI0033068F6F
MVMTLMVKAGVFGMPQLEEGDETRQGDQADQEQGDGALAHGEGGEVETTFAHHAGLS